MKRFGDRENQNGLLDRTDSSCPQADFVVCCHNNRNIIGAALDSIAAQTIPPASCTVVDGCSTDGTPEWILQHYPWSTVVIKPTDTGPADSRNIGMERGTAEFVVLMDSDVRLESDWTARQFELMVSDPRIGIAGGQLRYAPKPEMLYGFYGASNRFGVVWDGGMGKPVGHYKEPQRSLWANTSAVMVRRAMLQFTGGFDAIMFGAQEDSDFGWRANLLGYWVISNPRALSYHQLHGTCDPEVMQELLTYLVRRNRLRSMLVNYELINLLRYGLPYFILSLLDIATRAPRWEKACGVAWNLMHLPDTLRRRQWVQRHRIVRDHELWSLFESGLLGPGRDPWTLRARLFQTATTEKQSLQA